MFSSLKIMVKRDRTKVIFPLVVTKEIDLKVFCITFLG